MSKNICFNIDKVCPDSREPYSNYHRKEHLRTKEIRVEATKYPQDPDDYDAYVSHQDTGLWDNRSVHIYAWQLSPHAFPLSFDHKK